MKINEILAEKKQNATNRIKDIVTAFEVDTGMIVENVSVEKERGDMVQNSAYLVFLDIKLP